jgi:DNA-binding transcriptional MocR family regulator
MQIQLDRGSRTALHLQIAHQIKEQILRGAIPDGGRLPPTRKLAETLGVNRSTIVQAYESLWSEGLVESHVGRGTMVRHASGRQSGSIAPPPWAMLLAPKVEALEIELRELSRLFDREDVISFAAGLPGPDLYPVDEISRITCDLLEREGRSLLQWCTMQGHMPLRRILAEKYGTTPGEVLILSGSTQGLFILARAMIEPGDFVITEAPTYLGALQAFRSQGARIVGIPVDENGMDVDMLENVLSRTQPKFIYTLPTFQNPSGATMTLERRRRLLDLAYRYRIPLIEDDPYDPLRYEGDTLPSLKELDTHGYVVHLSSCTKILFPGLRIGWMVAPKRLIEQLTPSKHLLDIFTNSVAQAVIAEYLGRGLLEQHIERVRPEYRRRRDTMARALKRHCPDLSFSVPDGGYYIWCRLPRGLAAKDLLRESIRERVSFLNGDVFFPDDLGHEMMRLSFTSQTPEKIKEGIKKLGSCLKKMKRGRSETIRDIDTMATPIV